MRAFLFIVGLLSFSGLGRAAAPPQPGPPAASKAVELSRRVRDFMDKRPGAARGQEAHERLLKEFKNRKNRRPKFQRWPHELLGAARG